MRAGVLFKRSFSGIELRCVTYEEVAVIIREMHEGICGWHISSQFMAKMILCRGYYWLTMEADCANNVRRCRQCQIHADKIHAPASELNLTQTVWSFSMWAFDVMGPFDTEKKNRFILTATEYFTKWAEAEAFTEIKASNLCKFVRKNILSRFGILKKLVADNGAIFVSQDFKKHCKKFKIELHH